MAFLFDHFVGGYGKIARDCQSEHCCGLGVDHQIEFCRLLNWKIGWLRALQNFIYVAGESAKQVW